MIMPRSHSPRARSASAAATGACLLLLAACPGELPSTRYDGGGGGKDTSVVDAPGPGVEQGTPTLDKGPPTEAGLPPADTAKPPDTSKPPDQKPPPDQALPPDQGGGTTGAKCPPACATGYLCVNYTCRKICTDGTDVCKAITVCSTSESCQPVTSTQSVCIAATAPGGNCDKTFCGSQHVCASVNKAGFICLKVCKTKGASCGSGGKCVQATGSTCLFCTKN